MRESNLGAAMLDHLELSDRTGRQDLLHPARQRQLLSGRRKTDAGRALLHFSGPCWELLMPELKPLHVEVKFGPAIPGDVQGRALLEFERVLRRMMPGQWVETFKENKGDDSKLRMMMTKEERAKL